MQVLYVCVCRCVLTLKPAFIFIGKHRKRRSNEIMRVDSLKHLSRPALAMYQPIQTFSTHEIKEHEITYKAL